RSSDLRMEVFAGGLGSGPGIGRRMVAEDLYDEFAVAVDYVDQIQYRLIFRIKQDVQITVGIAVHFEHAALNSGTRLYYAQPVFLIDMLRQTRIATCGLQLARRFSWMANLP